MKYIIYDDGHNFVILQSEGDSLYAYFAECETKASAERVVAALNAAEKK